MYAEGVPFRSLGFAAQLRTLGSSSHKTVTAKTLTPGALRDLGLWNLTPSVYFVQFAFFSAICTLA